MPKIRRWALRARKLALWLVVLAALGVIAINVAINTPNIKGKVERAVSARFGAPAEIGLVTYFPPSEIKAREVRIGGDGGPEMAAQVTAHWRPIQTLGTWFSERTVVFDAIELSEAQFRIALPDPKPIPVAVAPPAVMTPLAPVLPPQPAPVEPTPPEQPSGEPIVVADSKSPEPKPSPAAVPPEAPTPAPKPPATPKPEPRKVTQVSFQNIAMRGAAIVIEDAPGGSVIGSVDGFDFQFAPASKDGALFEGSVDFGETQLMGHRVSEGGTATVVVKSLGIEVSDIRLPTKGGDATGRALVQFQPGRPFKLELRADALDLPALVSEFSASLPQLATGQGEAVLRMQGSAERPSEVRGRLRVVANGLMVEGGKDVANAGATFDLVGGNVLLTGAEARSGARWVKATGHVKRDGRLLINTRLYTGGETHRGFAVRAAVLRETPGELPFVWLSGTDWHYRDFLIAGTALNPQADLWGDGEWAGLPALLDAFLAEPELLAGGDLAVDIP